MTKRLVWLAIGFAVGVTLVLRTQRSLRERGTRLKPERIASDLAQALRDFGLDLRKAMEEGRTAMAGREAELRDRLQVRTGTEP